MPWVTFDADKLTTRTETELEVYMRGAKIPVINDDFPGLDVSMYMTQAELLQSLEQKQKQEQEQAQAEGQAQQAPQQKDSL